MDLHPACTPLADLLGTWRGSGQGEYPTIEPFAYNEEVTFGHAGKPFLAYSQRTTHAETGMPLHSEAGYLRAVGDTAIELVLVQPSGIIEMHSGHVTAVDNRTRKLDLRLDAVHTTATALSVTDVVRAISFPADSDDDEPSELNYTVAMAAVGVELTHHLAGTLHKV